MSWSFRLQCQDISQLDAFHNCFDKSFRFQTGKRKLREARTISTAELTLHPVLFCTTIASHNETIEDKRRQAGPNDLSAHYYLGWDREE